MEIFTLPSGIKILYTTSDNSLSAISVWLRAGSCFDPVGKEGLSHFFEHLLMIRTQRHPEKRERMIAIESMGIDFNALTNYEVASYSHIQRQEVLLESMDLFLEGFFNSIFDESNILHEKNIILDESVRNFSDPSQYMWQLSSQGLWPNSLLGRNFFGDADSLKNITLDDIKNFQEKFYVPDNMYFVVIGQNKHKQKILTKIEKYSIDNHLGGSFDGRKKIDYLSSKNIIKDIRTSNNRVNVGINYQTSPIDDQRRIVVQDFLRSYLASGWTSCLTKKLRDEHGLTYWVNGTLESFFDTGYLRFSFSVEKKCVSKSLQMVYSEIKKLVDGDIDMSIVDATKSIMLTALSRHYSDIGNELWLYGFPFALGVRPLPLDEYFSQIQSLTKNQILQEAKILFSSAPTVALIGDVENILI